MHRPSATRVASRHLEAGVSEWLAWIVQPFAVLFRRSGECVDGPVDDAMDNVIRELAPTIVHAIGEREVDEDVDEFVTGAVHGRHDARGGLYEDDDSSWSQDYRAGYHWGYANAATWTTPNIPNDVRSRVIRENLVEFRFMVEWLGMTPMEALVAATGRAAECIGRSDVGVIEAGRYADVLVVDGDPLSNIRILEERERIKLVMKAGRAYTNTL